MWSQYGKKSHFDLPHSRKRPLSYNHLGNNSCLVTKNGLYNSLRAYHNENKTDLWRSVPLTFHLKSGVDDEERQRFLSTAANDALEADQQASLLSAAAVISTTPTSPSTLATSAATDAGITTATTLDVTPLTKETKAKKKKETTKATKSSTPPKYWIVKPASQTNRGFGIRVVQHSPEVIDMVDKYYDNKQEQEQEKKQEKEASEEKGGGGGTSAAAKTVKKKKKGHREWVVQRYIHNPLLYKGRKFDIRVFVLLVSRGSGKKLECHVFNDGYLRTSSHKFSLDPNKLSDQLMHLTNDGIQCKNEKEYGKHEEGNKLSYMEFNDWLVKKCPEHRGSFENQILPRINELVAESIAATHMTLNLKKRTHCFELLGYDFMVDDAMNTYLIEINSNPCLEDWSCPLLRHMLPVLLDKILTKVTGTPSGSTTSTHRLAKDDAEKEKLANAARGKFTILDIKVPRQFELVWKTPEKNGGSVGNVGSVGIVGSVGSINGSVSTDDSSSITTGQKSETERTSPEILEEEEESILKQQLPLMTTMGTTGSTNKEAGGEEAQDATEGSEIPLNKDTRKDLSSAGKQRIGGEGGVTSLSPTTKEAKQLEKETKKLTTPVAAAGTTVTAEELEEMKREKSARKNMKKKEEEDKVEEMEPITFGFRKLNINR